MNTLWDMKRMEQEIKYLRGELNRLQTRSDDGPKTNTTYEALVNSQIKLKGEHAQMACALRVIQSEIKNFSGGKGKAKGLILNIARVCDKTIPKEKP